MERVASRTGFSLGNDHFIDLDYADDLVLLGHKIYDIHSALKVSETTASQLGSHVSLAEDEDSESGCG